MHGIHTVNDIKNIGYKIKVRHLRHTNKDGTLCSKGGSTHVTITDNFGHSSEGHSKCSKFDTFSKKLGIAIAIGRALKNQESYVNK